MNHTSFFLFAPVVMGIVCLGCGAPEAVEATLEQNVYAQIEGLGDSAGNAQRFAEAFVDGAAPENRHDYAGRGYQIAEEATIEGDTAIVPVTIFGGVYSSSDSDRSSRKSSTLSETTQTWTLKLVGDEWKIQDAPLD